MNPWISLNRKFLILRAINRMFIFIAKTSQSVDFAAFPISGTLGRYFWLEMSR